MCLGAHVYQVRRYTTYAALAIGATRSLLGLGIKLIKPVNGTLKDITFDLQEVKINELNTKYFAHHPNNTYHAFKFLGKPCMEFNWGAVTVVALYEDLATV